MRSLTKKKTFASLTGRQAFIIATLMFFFLAQFAEAQKTSVTYLCRCGARGYGCSPTGSACAAYCARRCGGFIIPVPVYANYISQSNFRLFTLPLGMSTAKIFDTKGALKTLPGSKKQQSIRQIEWGFTDEALKLPAAL
jgi:hypothetical protein